MQRSVASRIARYICLGLLGLCCVSTINAHCVTLHRGIRRGASELTQAQGGEARGDGEADRLEADEVSTVDKE
jgi:hypothetical protein